MRVNYESQQHSNLKRCLLHSCFGKIFEIGLAEIDRLLLHLKRFLIETINKSVVYLLLKEDVVISIVMDTRMLEKNFTSKRVQTWAKEI